MPYESSGVRVDADDGIATLWLDFPGEPVNALSPVRLEEFAGGVAAVVATPGVEILVVRSSKPAGFCAGIDFDTIHNLETDADRIEFVRNGRIIFSQLAAVPFPTVAYIHGPCLGAGLELALACNSRLAVSGPDSAIGFPDAARGLIPCWGGATRLARLIGRKPAIDWLHSGRILSGREAVRLGLFDDAFCERRSKIELRTYLDRLQREGTKPHRWRGSRRQVVLNNTTVSSIPKEVFDEVCRAAERTSSEGESYERKWFTFWLKSEVVRSRLELSVRTSGAEVAVPEVGFVGDWTNETAALAGRAALRGGRVLVASHDDRHSPFLDHFFHVAVQRGFVTPLEADLARRRIECTPAFVDAGLVIRAAENDITITVGGEHHFTLGLPIAEFESNLVEIGSGSHADDSSAKRVSGWLARLGYAPVVVADCPELVVRRILYAVFDEAVRLVAEGVPVALIDAVGAKVLPTGGPLRRLDAVGIPSVAGVVKRLLPMAATGTTFYRIVRRSRSVPNAEAGALLWDSRFAATVAEQDCSVARPAGNLPVSTLSQEIADRLEYRAINEAARCLHDDPFAAPVEIDQLAADGAGVFAAAGGPLAVADIRDPSVCVRTLQRLAARLGSRFHPCPGLVRRAVAGEYFRMRSPSESGLTIRLRVA